MDSTEVFFHDRVNNRKWFTARGLAAISTITGLSPDAAAKIICTIILFWLMGQNAWIVCNTIVVTVPLLLTFTFPDERPPAENMRVYWITAFTVSAFDRMLEVFPLYYVAKLTLLLFLLVEPSCLNDRLKILLKATVNSKGSAGDEEQESRKSEAVDQPPGSSQPPLIQGTAPKSPLTATEPTNQNIRSATPSSSGAPTPYDANPPMYFSTASSGSVNARASIAPPPPVGVGEQGNAVSTYVNIPKPVGKKDVRSLRLAPDQQISNQRSESIPLNVARTRTNKRKKDFKRLIQIC
ncbi:hypothetical protein KIN20_007360 [Parelaphostrongylus tenuis]|uniref:Receptor expression-enhancing protein n=1 Tax=Parelaphostrongylus tenuis TaxID=148309 RepID=A0AAD5QJ43_PARTN|nr:hypothetical protein KIN20_007360 [Parelaphostrongylus tenuis]